MASINKNAPWSWMSWMSNGTGVKTVQCSPVWVTAVQKTGRHHQQCLYIISRRLQKCAQTNTNSYLIQGNECVHTFKHAGHIKASVVYTFYPSLQAAKTLFPPCPGATHHEVVELLADGGSRGGGRTLQSLSGALWWRWGWGWRRRLVGGWQQSQQLWSEGELCSELARAQASALQAPTLVLRIKGHSFLLGRRPSVRLSR